MKAHLFSSLAVVCLVFAFNTRVAGYTVHIVTPAVNNHMILQDGPLPPVYAPPPMLHARAYHGGLASYSAASCASLCWCRRSATW